MFTPKIAKIYSLNFQEMVTCEAFLKEHLETGRIKSLKFPQASPFFFIPKKDGTLCPCQDYHYLNSHTIWNAYPLPLIPELIDNMKDSTIFTKFNIRWGYNNIHLWEEDQWKAAFITPMGLFEPTVMFLSFCNAPPTFQAFMNHIFVDMLTKKWLKIYMGDLGIQTKDDLPLHHERTQWVLQWLQEHGLTVKLSNMVFDALKMEFLGMIIRQGKVEMDRKKLKAIRDWKPPTTVKAVRSFTGFANFYWKFIPNFSNVVTPLNLLTWKNEPWNWAALCLMNSNASSLLPLYTKFLMSPDHSLSWLTLPYLQLGQFSSKPISMKISIPVPIFHTPSLLHNKNMTYMTENSLQSF